MTAERVSPPQAPAAGASRGPSLPGRLAEWLLATACLAPTVVYPLTADQGVFAYVGQVIRDGGFPYRDVFEQKGPVVHYTYALALTLFGESEMGVRLFFFFVAVVTAQVAAAVAGRLGGRGARLPAALCTALALLWSEQWGAWQNAQAEDLALPLMLGGLLAALSAGSFERRGRLVLAGALFSLACLAKPTTAVAVVAMGLTAAWEWNRQCGVSAGGVLRRLGWAALGLALPAVAFGLFFAVFGVLDDFWTCVVEHNTRAYGRTGAWLSAWMVAFVERRWRALTLLAVVGALAGQRGSPLGWRLLLTAAAASWLAVVLQAKYFLYHWTPFVGSLAVMAGAGTAFVAERLGALFRGRLLRWSATAGAAVVLPLTMAPSHLYHVLPLWAETVRVARGQETAAEFRLNRLRGSERPRAVRELAAIVRERTRPDDTVLVWGHAVLVHFLSGRRSPSRFAIDAYLRRGGSPHVEAWRQEFLAALRERPPALVVVVEGDTTAIEREDSMTQLRQFPELKAWLDAHYVEERQLDCFHLYRRTDARPPRP